MPLLSNKIHVLNPPVKKERKSKDGAVKAEVAPPKYVIPHTGEVCATEMELNRKVSLYKEKIWTCRCTGKQNMSHKDALHSEQQTLKVLKKNFPKCFEKTVLETVHHTVESLDSLVHRAWSTLHQEFCINEPVSIKVSSPAKANFVGVIVKAEKSADEQSPVKANGTTTDSPSNSSDKENTSAKKATGPPPKKNYFYSVKLLDQDKIVSRIPASAISRDFKPPFKDHVRMFIRAHALRYGPNFTGPWVVDEDYLKKHKIASKNVDYEVDKQRLKQLSVQTEEEYLARVANKAAGGSPSKSFKTSRISILRGEIEKKAAINDDDDDEDLPLMVIKKKQKGLLTPSTKKKLKQTTLFDLGSTKSKSGSASTTGTLKSAFSATPNRTALPPIATRLIKMEREGKLDAIFGHMVTRCAQFLTPAQVQLLPVEVKERVREKQIKLEEKRKLHAMTPEQREEFFKAKRLENLERRIEERRQKNRRFEDSTLATSSKPLPVPEPLSLGRKEELTADQIAQVLALTELMRCFSGLILPPESEKAWREWEAAEGVSPPPKGVYGSTCVLTSDALVWALMSGREGFLYLGHLLTILLQTLLQDDSMSNRRELGSKLSEIPVTPYTASEMLRLVLTPPSQTPRTGPSKEERRRQRRLAAKAKKEQEAASAEEDQKDESSSEEDSSSDEEDDDRDVYASEDYAELVVLCERLRTVEFYDLTLDEKLTLLLAMQRRVLDLEMLNEHMDEYQRRVSEAWKRKISELKRRNDRVKEEKAIKKEKTGTAENTEEKKEKKKDAQKEKVVDGGGSTSDMTKFLNGSGPSGGDGGTEDLASVVKRRRIMAAQAQKEREEKERLERERRQIEAAQQAEEKVLQTVSRDLEQAMTDARSVFRWTPLGTDRNHNRYWRFLASRPGVYVEKGWAPEYYHYSLLPDDTSRTPGRYSSPNKKNEEGSLDHEMKSEETTFPSVTDRHCWCIYRTEDQLNALMASLNTKGSRESRLKEELSKIIEEEKVRIKAAEKAQMDEETPEKVNKSENPLVEGFKTELGETYVRLYNGGLSLSTEPLATLQSRLDLASKSPTMSKLSQCLIDVQTSIVERFLCGPFTAKRAPGVDDLTAPLLESPKVQEWKDAVLASPTQSRLNLLQGYLDACIRWEKSVEDAKCHICRRKNDEELLLCDGCNQAFHLYCLRPPLADLPEGDWFCPSCKPPQSKSSTRDGNVANGRKSRHQERGDEDEDESSESESDDAPQNDSECLLCNIGPEGEEELVACSRCPNTFHFLCHEPPLRHQPRGDWACSDCRLGTRLRQQKRGKPKASTKSKKSGGRGSSSSQRAPIRYKEESSEDEEPENGRRRSNRKPVVKKKAKVTSSSENEEDSDVPVKAKARRTASGRRSNPPASRSRRSALDSDDENASDDSGVEASRPSKSRSRTRTSTASRGSTGRKMKRSVISSEEEDEAESEEEVKPASKRARISATSKPPVRRSSKEDEAESEEEVKPASKKARISATNKAPVRRSSKEEAQIGKSILESLWRHRSAWPFIEPVDLKEVPDYLNIVKNPIDLSTMKEKQREGHYTCLSDVIADIHLMFANSETYNEPHADVYQATQRLELFFIAQMAKLAPDLDCSRKSKPS